MKLIRKLYLGLFNIIATGVPSWNMILFYTKPRQNENYQNFEKNGIGNRSQMARLVHKDRVNIAIVDDKAYWVHDNKFYTSYINEYGLIDKDAAEIIDVFSMSEEEIEELLDILDNISY